MASNPSNTLAAVETDLAFHKEQIQRLTQVKNMLTGQNFRASNVTNPAKRGRGRPKGSKSGTKAVSKTGKRGPGRPRKVNPDPTSLPETPSNA
jgi:hypothetical protein